MESGHVVLGCGALESMYPAVSDLTFFQYLNLQGININRAVEHFEQKSGLT